MPIYFSAVCRIYGRCEISMTFSDMISNHNYVCAVIMYCYDVNVFYKIGLGPSKYHYLWWESQTRNKLQAHIYKLKTLHFSSTHSLNN